MSAISYIKRVRTRHRNNIQNAISESRELMQTDLESADVETVLFKVSKFLEKIKINCDKLEVQTEKLVTALENEESEQQITDEDGDLCDQAMECYMDLKHFKDKINSTREKEEKLTFYQDEKFEMMQKEIQSLKIELKQEQTQGQIKQEHAQQQGNAKCHVKLPKLDMVSYGGDKLKWTEFWDSFENVIHQNRSLTNVEKFTYLKSKVYGDARQAIAGLSLTNDNYDCAIQILRDRFGDIQQVIDLHYSKLMSLPNANNSVQSLRHFLDHIERHLRSLEVLKQNVDQDIFVSMIRSKLPQEVLLQLELLNGTSGKWTVTSLRERLQGYITAREKSEKESTPYSKSETNKNITFFKGASNRGSFVQNKFQGSKPSTSAESLMANTNPERSYHSSSTRKMDYQYSNLCRYCSKKHWSDECRKYATLAERKRQLQDSCYKCLKTGHKTNECHANRMCVHCGIRNDHHRSLCPKKFNTSQTSVHMSEEILHSNEHESSNTSPENALMSSGEMVLMQTATTTIQNEDKTQSVRLLLDSGSQRSYISEKLANKLGLKKEKEEEIRIMTFGTSNSKTIKTKVSSVNLGLQDGSSMKIAVNIVPVISGLIERRPVKSMSPEAKNIMNSVQLADTITKERETSSVELLIGNDYYLDLVTSQKIEIQPGLYLLSSKFGWILSGRTLDSETNKNNVNMFVMSHGNTLSDCSTCTSLDQSLRSPVELEDFWNIEAIGIKDSPFASSDEKAMHKFKETVQFHDGRYQVTWPWKDENPELPSNKELAYGRLKSSITRMKKNPEILGKYDNIIQEQLKNGIIEKVCDDSNQNMKHYIPHHAVITPQKSTTKLRIVYDASAKTRKTNHSLNDCLYRGPVLLNDLCGIMLRFRMHEIAMVADIEKAFLQIGLQKGERDVTRFLWLKDYTQNVHDPGNITEYRFCRVPFGVVSSPFLLGATIEHHLDKYQDEQMARKLKRNIYVDNLITGTDSKSEAMSLYTNSKSLFSKAAMNLREWLSNDQDVNKFLSPEDRSNSNKQKVLGHSWNIEADCISVTSAIKEMTNAETKRTVLQTVASLYDPLGLFSPVILRGKQLIQNLWKKKIDWDQEIDEGDQREWSQIKKDLSQIQKEEIKRCVTLPKSKEEITTNLVCFCDASEKAYACCIYLHQQTQSASKVELIFSKSRLAPVKELTIPKLEILAVLIGVRCVQFIKNQMDIPLNNTYLYTDSKCVLHWIFSSKDLPIFIKNRVNEIKSHQDINFGYVPTKQNAADISSRGMSLENLNKCDLWWHGPSFLQKDVSSWTSTNTQDPESSVNDCDHSSCLLTTETEEKKEESVEMKSPFGIDLARYSSLTKVLRVTAYCSRFVKRLRGKKQQTDFLTSCELQCASNMWLKYVQNSEFKDVKGNLTKSKSNNLIQQLGLFIDNEGIIRCKGRVENSTLSFGAKCPVLLPKHGLYTEMVVQKAHSDILHSGVSQTLSKVRNNYWITHGRSVIKCVLKKCNVCRKCEGGPYKMPNMPPLPKSRVSESKPFTVTGLDYLGPVYIKTHQDSPKVWICLFTCTVTRAVHLEIVNDMTSEEFLLAFRRFIAQHGVPREVISDNALQFKAADKLLANVLNKVIHCEDVQNYATNKGIKWTFIVELAPWMGGMYERLVGLVKRSLRKTLGKRLITNIQLQTLVKEIEAVINSRPLVYVGDDIDSSITITPAHLISPNKQPSAYSTPEGDSSDEEYQPTQSTESKLLKMWKKGHHMIKAFWKIWRDEYLLSLRERYQVKLKSKRIQSNEGPMINDIVLVKDELPRGCWRLGKIIQLITSSDGNQRSAKVLLASGRVIGRPLNLLYPIEVSSSKDHLSDKNNSNSSSSSVNSKTDTVTVQDPIPSRPVRRAAETARQKFKSWLS